MMSQTGRCLRRRPAGRRCSCPPPLPSLLPLRAQGVCPGDVLMALPEAGVVRIGGGVQQEGRALVATKAGVLRQERNGQLWVEARCRR